MTVFIVNGRRSNRRRDRCTTGVALLLGITLLACGCSSHGTNSADTPATPTADPRESLRQLAQRYRQCTRYSDRALVHLEYGQGAQRASETSTLTVQFERPARMALQIERGINRLQLVSNGQSLWVGLADPLTQNMKGQIVQRPAPAQWTTGEIYAATELVDPLRPQEMLSVLLGLPLDLERSQLGLLLGSEVWQLLLENPGELQTLPDERWQGTRCRRLQIPSPAGDGTFVLWLDPQLGTLRRVDLPTGQLFAQLPAEQRPTDLALWMDLEPAVWDGPDRSDAFQAPPPKYATLVQHFVLPTVALPSPRFGQAIADFDLSTLDGAVEHSRDWAERIAVLVWFQDHPTCRALLPRLEQVFQVFQSFQQQQDRIVWRAVCTEPNERLSSDQIRQLVTAWGVTLPVVRDLTAAGRDQLDIAQAPTLVVLDGQRRLQMFEIGANPNLSQTLTLVLQRLLQGENVAADVLRNHQTELQAYEQQLQLARLPDGRTAAPAAALELPPESPPKKLTRQLRWQCRELQSPGNVIVADGPQQTPRLIVLDQMQQAVELDLQGNVVKRFPLETSEAAPITQWRWAATASGTGYFVGLAPLAPQLVCYDQDFQLLFRYPDAAPRQAGIMDAQLADLDEDGQVELYVGFADPLGVHRVDMDGKRRWGNRAVTGIVSLVPRLLAKPPHLLMAGEQGAIVPVSRAGAEGPPIAVSNRTIHQMAHSLAGDPRPTQFLGMSYTLEGRLIAIGLTPALEEAWSYGLPAGTYQTQVQTPVWTRLLAGPSGQWLLAGADGSVHLVDDSGDFFDMFHTGQQVEGLAGLHHDGQAVLIVCGGGAVTAYNVGRKE